jgi:hypothetical protein
MNLKEYSVTNSNGNGQGSQSTSIKQLVANHPSREIIRRMQESARRYANRPDLLIREHPELDFSKDRAIRDEPLQSNSPHKPSQVA